MGMFDSILNPREDPDPRFSDFALSMLPIAGPFMAKNRYKKRAEKDYQNSLDSIYKYVDEDPLSQRVAQRMLSRTGEESIPGIMAATEATKQAQRPENMGNFGNVLMNTATNLQGKGVPGSANLAAAAHKAFQTPWKPSEGGVDFENYKLPDGTVVAAETPAQKRLLIGQGGVKAGVASGEQDVPWSIVPGYELKMQGREAGGSYAVQYNKDGTIKDIKTLGGMDVNVSGGSIFSKPDMSQAVGGYADAITSTKMSVGVVDRIMDTLDKNPTGGVSGVSGMITNFVGAVSNVAEFGLSFASDKDRSTLAKYEKGLIGVARKFFPTGDEATVRAQIIELAYALARMNNMGTSGGGRGITDADMEYALKQLGTMSTVEDFKGVLSYQRNKMLENLTIQKAAVEAKVRLGGGDPAELAPLNHMYDSIKTRAGSAKPKAPPQAEAEVRANPALKEEFFKKFGYYPDGV